MESPFSTNARLITDENDICVLSHEALDISDILATVSSHETGAIATFIGQTRNNFNGNTVHIYGKSIKRLTLPQGKTVTRLEYQVGSPLSNQTTILIM